MPRRQIPAVARPVQDLDFCYDDDNDDDDDDMQQFQPYSKLCRLFSCLNAEEERQEEEQEQEDQQTSKLVA